MPITKYRLSSDQAHPNFFEMLGMPASGKTTFMDQLLQQDQTFMNINGKLNPTHLKRQAYKFACIAMSFLRYPISSFQNFWIIVGTQQRSAKDFLNVIANWYLITYSQKRHQDEEKRCIWDQGIWQALWSIAFSAQKRVDFDKLLAGALLPEVVYVVDVSDEELRKRAKARNLAQRLNYESHELEACGRAALCTVVAKLREKGYVVEEDIA